MWDKIKAFFKKFWKILTIPFALIATVFITKASTSSNIKHKEIKKEIQELRKDTENLKKENEKAKKEFDDKQKQLDDSLTKAEDTLQKIIKDKAKRDAEADKFFK